MLKLWRRFKSLGASANSSVEGKQRFVREGRLKQLYNFCPSLTWPRFFAECTFWSDGPALKVVHSSVLHFFLCGRALIIKLSLTRTFQRPFLRNEVCSFRVIDLTSFSACMRGSSCFSRATCSKRRSNGACSALLSFSSLVIQRTDHEAVTKCIDHSSFIRAHAPLAFRQSQSVYFSGFFLSRLLSLFSRWRRS